MAEITVTPEKLHDIAAQLRQVAAEQEVLTQKTRALVNNFNGAWQSDSTTVCTNRILSLVSNEQEKSKLLSMLADEITKVVQIYEIAESELSELASNFT